MNWQRLAILIAIAADLGLLSVGLVVANAENCNNGVARWECSESLRDFTPGALVVTLVVTGLPIFWRPDGAERR